MATTKKKTTDLLDPVVETPKAQKTAKYINTRQGNTFTSKGRIASMDTVTLPVDEGDVNVALKKV